MILYVLIFLLITVTTVLSEENPYGGCNTNVVVIICKPETTPTTILPKVLGKRHEDTVELESKLNRQIHQTVVLLKSIAISSLSTEETNNHPFLYPKSNSKSACVNFIIVGKNPNVLTEIENQIEKESWDKQFRSKFHLSFIPAKYPPGTEWMENVYRQCATLRLFLPQILPPSIKQIIYVDTDIIFLRHPSTLQEGFQYFNTQQLAGITPELEIRTDVLNGLYNPQSYNTGVMLMDLEKMRITHWTAKVGIVAELVLKDAYYGDQDVLIVYFKFNRNELMDLPCHWNYMPKYCRINCGQTNGISIIHGLVASFFLPPGSPYEVLFRFYHQYPMSSNFSTTQFNSKLGNRLWTRTKRDMDINSTNYCARWESNRNGNQPTFASSIMKTIQQPNQQQPNKSLFPPTVVVEEKSPQPKQLLFNKTHYIVFPGPSPNPDPKSISENNIVIGITFIESIYKYYNQLPLLTALLKSIFYAQQQSANQQKMKLTVVIITDNLTNCYRIHELQSAINQEEQQTTIRLECIVGNYTKEFNWLSNVFKPGVFFRLVYPEIIGHDSIIHVDTDIIFRQPISYLWNQLNQFSNSQILGAAKQLSIEGTTKDLFPETAYQAGIMLMNLTKMREIQWSQQLLQIAQMLKPNFDRCEKILPVQTILHLYFKYHPSQIMKLDTAWNFLPHYCQNNPTHLDLNLTQIFAIHGVNNSFTRSDTMEPLFRQIYLDIIERENTNFTTTNILDPKTFTSLCATSELFQREWFK